MSEAERLARRAYWASLLAVVPVVHGLPCTTTHYRVSQRIPQPLMYARCHTTPPRSPEPQPRPANPEPKSRQGGGGETKPTGRGLVSLRAGGRDFYSPRSVLA